MEQRAAEESGRFFLQDVEKRAEFFSSSAVNFSIAIFGLRYPQYNALSGQSSPHCHQTRNELGHPSEEFGIVAYEEEKKHI